MRELVLELAHGIRSEVLPLLGVYAGRARLGSGGGGDITFEIDEVGEAYLERFVADVTPPLAFYSEDRGLVAPPTGSASYVLVVDPVDGTRPALAGLEAACVSVAAAPLPEKSDALAGLTMGDVQFGCIVELKSAATFLAERGKGVEMIDHDLGVAEPKLSNETDLESIFWTLGLRGRPARVLIEVLGDLIDASSVKGGVFDLGSATYDMTRLLSGQLDAYLDIGTRIIDDLPEIRVEFERVGQGAVLNNSPYDLAAALLCLEEGGAVVSDAFGEPLGSRPLLGSGHEFQTSCVAAANEQLHVQLLEAIDRGIARLSESIDRVVETRSA